MPYVTHEWKIACTLGLLTVGNGERVKSIGIINASSESFYSGSVIRSQEAVECANMMLKAGADGFNVGAMSTVPCFKASKSEEQEIRRIALMVKAIYSMLRPARFLQTHKGTQSLNPLWQEAQVTKCIRSMR